MLQELRRQARHHCARKHVIVDFHTQRPGWYDQAYKYRRPLVLAVYAAIGVTGYLGGFLLRFEFSAFDLWVDDFLLTAPLVAAVRLSLARLLHLSTGRWRFISTSDVLRLLVATSAGTVLLLGFRWALLGSVTIPLSVLLMEWVLTTQLTGALWVAYRTSFERLRHSQWIETDDRRRTRVLIIGAGEAGNVLAREIRRFPTGYELVGIIDDDPLKAGERIQGCEVLGVSARLPAIARATAAQEVILAVPSAGPEELQRLVALCGEAALPFKVLPGIREVLDGDVGLNQLREVQIEDLLGREPVELELPQLRAELDGATVLITGAAGSIGSELARQVALNRPRRLVLLDQAETALFYLDLELRHRHAGLEIIPVVADIADASGMERIFRDSCPDHVLHAAAYKHVPMMEGNAREAIRNNVLGTWRVADAAGRHGTRRFVLVSTDKAVSPTNVMGATKRLAELIVLDLQQRFPATTYGAVRFGNVLGSNGSVIPIFKRQISEGRPVTVTHPDATRYFMTIPEAVQLILQASLLQQFRGRIAMLDMGDPVRITDLALNLLRLSGVARPEERVVFTGLRPGEKLHEELAAPDEEAQPTSVPKVRVLTTPVLLAPALVEQVQAWDAALRRGCDDTLIAGFYDLFPLLRAEPRQQAPPAAAQRARPHDLRMGM
jgi:FlaA1/EpsC-like NDP-sugar epimerase